MADKYVAPYFRPWENVGLISPLGLECLMKSPEGSPGCLLVFESMEALLEVYPDVDPSIVMTLQDKTDV